MTKQQKICGAVLALAASAFGVDRGVIGSGPSDGQAQAGHSSAPAVPARPPARAGGAKDVAAAADPAGGAKAAPGLRTLAARMREAADADRLDRETVPDA